MTDKCGAILSLGDDMGDNDCTFKCQLEKGHEGLHQENSTQEHQGKTGSVVMTWELDEREWCPKHSKTFVGQCHDCFRERHDYREEYTCDQCFGMKPGEEEHRCDRCLGTGYDIVRHRDIVDQCRRDGTFYWTRETEMLFPWEQNQE
jgi:hypothetical protein